MTFFSLSVTFPIVWRAWSIGSKFKEHCSLTCFFFFFKALFWWLVKRLFFLSASQQFRCPNEKKQKTIDEPDSFILDGHSWLFHHPAVWVHNDPVWYTAEQRGLTQNRLLMRHYVKPVFPPPYKRCWWPHSGWAFQTCDCVSHCCQEALMVISSNVLIVLCAFRVSATLQH